MSPAGDSEKEIVEGGCILQRNDQQPDTSVHRWNPISSPNKLGTNARPKARLGTKEKERKYEHDRGPSPLTALLKRTSDVDGLAPGSLPDKNAHSDHKEKGKGQTTAAGQCTKPEPGVGISRAGID